MRRSIILVLTAIAAFSVVPAHAGLNTSTALQQSFYVQAGGYHPNGYTGVFLYLLNEVAITTVGTAAAPGVRFEASGGVQECDLTWVCTNQSFAPQTVNPTAFTMDPAGNSGTFRACLLPTSGPCKTFDVTMTRPGYTAVLCGGICLSESAWYDPTTQTIGGNAFAQAGVYRQNYVVAGVFAGGAPRAYANTFSAYNFALITYDTAN